MKQCSQHLREAPDYVSSLLKNMTGKNTRQHIQLKIIKIAKTRLSTTTRSVSEIAYELGFEQSQSFNKLFKRLTAQTPIEFRNSFN